MPNPKDTDTEEEIRPKRGDLVTIKGTPTESPEAAPTGPENVKAWTTPDPKKADVCSSTTKQLTLF